MIGQNKRIEDLVDLLSAERIPKQKIIASRWALKQQFKNRSDFRLMNAVVDTLTEDELEWLAWHECEGYADCQRRADFFEHRALLLRRDRGLEDVE